jgi:hypothetical protein
METEKALDIICKCVALAEFKISLLGKKFCGTK